VCSDASTFRFPSSKAIPSSYLERGADQHCDLGAAQTLRRGLLSRCLRFRLLAKGEIKMSPNASCLEESSTSTGDNGLSAFLNMRSRLYGIAYRMLGSAAEAEDTVQDVWVRWQTTDRSVVRDARAFLARNTTRLATNVGLSARSRRDTHAGPWVREPVDTRADPGSGAERGEALRSALLV